MTSERRNRTEGSAIPQTREGVDSPGGDAAVRRAGSHRFGPFVLDVARGELRRGDEPVQLRPKTFEVLHHLAQNPGRLIGKEEFFRIVWRDVIVTEDSLVQCITELRQALGDTGRTLIKTVPRRGYLFNLQSPDSVPPPEGAPWGALGVALSSRHRWVAAAAVLLAAAIAFTITRKPEPSHPAPVRSLAVLPFSTLGTPGTVDESFGLGMADAVIIRLSGLRQIAVRPTSAVIPYAAQPVSPIRAGRDLDTDLVLEGHLQRARDRVRVTAQLIDVRAGSTLWTGTFDERFTDIFALQDALATKVVASISMSLSQQEMRQLIRRDTSNQDAYEAYLKGRYFWGKRTEKALEQSISYFEQAIAMDPRYALAYAGLADAFNLVGAYGSVAPREAFVRAKEAALQALEIDGTLAAAHASLAFAKAHADHDWAQAETEYRKAIALDPGYATGHQWYALSLVALGRFDDAIGEAREGLRADPLSLIINTDMGRHFYYARRYDESIAQLRRTIDLDSSFMRAHFELGRAYGMKGQHDLAIAELQRAAALSKRSAAALAALGAAYARAGQGAEARRILRELEDRAKQAYVSAYHFAVIHAGLGEISAALSFLVKSYDERFNWVVFANVEPEFDGLRADPRFADLVKRLRVSE